MAEAERNFTVYVLHFPRSLDNTRSLNMNPKLRQVAWQEVLKTLSTQISNRSIGCLECELIFFCFFFENWHSIKMNVR